MSLPSSAAFPCGNAMRHSLSRGITSLFAQSIHRTLQSLPVPQHLLHGDADSRTALTADVDVMIAPCKKESMGDYQCNNAMSLSSMLMKHHRSTTANTVNQLNNNRSSSSGSGSGGASNGIGVNKELLSSRHIAQSIVDNLPASDRDRMLQDVSVAEPGFVRFRVNRDWLSDILHESFLRHELHRVDDGSTQVVSHNGANAQRRKKVIVDFSSPNLAKEMHVGHLRSTIIGDVISRILEYYEDDQEDTRYDVMRLNHLGDWGTQFGMLIAYMKREGLYQRVLDEWQPEHINNGSSGDLVTLHDLQEFYRSAKLMFDADEAFKREAHAEVIALQSGQDAECIKAWQFLCECSRRENQKTYDKLEVQLTDRGESFYGPFIPHVIDLLSKVSNCNGAPLLQESHGAKVVFVPSMMEEHPPLMIQKSDGGYTYDTTDVAAIWQRLKKECADWLIYVTDSGQSVHFDLVFEAARMAGWLDSDKHRLDFVGFGVVLGEDGKKFKTRSGEVVKLEALLEEAKFRAKAVIKAKNDERVKENPSLQLLTEEELDHAAEVVGYGAVKYSDLKSHRITNYLFSFDRILDFRGNTAVYLFYAYARIQSIMSRVEEAYDFTEKELKAGRIRLEHRSEVSLALQLCKFPTVLEQIVRTLEPHHMCDFLYETATQFSGFHRDCRVLGNEDNRDLAISRYLLCKATSRVMKQCFTLLGLNTLDRL